MKSSDPWWRDVGPFAEIASRLDEVWAIDVHTHLLDAGSFDPRLDPQMPLRLRSTEPSYWEAVSERFGIEVGPGGIEAAASDATRVRADMIDRLGEHGYWIDHLDFTRTEIALVNQEFPEGTDGSRLRWVPYGSDLIYPLPSDSLMARSPKHETGIRSIQSDLQRFLTEAELEEVPADLDGYMGFVDRTLARWKEQGAVAVKFFEAYLRTLLFEDVPLDAARSLYEAGRAAPLPRDEYLALQDFLTRHIFLEAGRLGLAVHIHTGHGVPPFLQAREADVRNLEPVLTDVRFFETNFVLIHGGQPDQASAAYQALKPHVWVDISAMPFLYEVPRLAEALRTYLRYCPEKVLFGTDVGGYPGVPVGPEVQHVALSRHARESLYAALAGMVHDRMSDLEYAVRIGEGVLRENAQPLIEA
jgi:predicted TIM-barrel fold metal-dependent hydrolase